MVVFQDFVAKLHTFQILLGLNWYGHIHIVQVVCVPALEIGHIFRDIDKVDLFNKQE